MMKNKIYTALLALMIAGSATAQDFHLSQYDMTPHYLNPALTGMYCGEPADYRIYSDYRSQWNSAALNPFSTAYLAFDMSTVKWDQDFGLGAYFINNNSGVSSLNSFNIMLSAAYNIMGNSQGRHALTTGVQVGILHKGFDPDNLTYDAQYSQAMGGFDNGIPSGEYIDRSSVTAFDANYGIYYKYTEAGKRAHPFGGVSLYHLTRPNESFTSAPSKMPMRVNVHGGCDLKVNEFLQFSPRFLFMNQAKSQELSIGFLTHCKIPNSPYAAQLQFDCRSGDAVVIGLGLMQNQHTFRISYDIGTSSMNNYLDGNGSWEFALVLTGIKGKSLFGKGQTEHTSDIE